MLKKPFFTVAVIAGIISGAFVGFLFAEYSQLPDIRGLQEFRPPIVSKVYSDDNQLVAEFFEENRRLLKYEDIPKSAIDAVLAIEDHKFFSHKGVRIVSILRALWVDIKSMGYVQGGSTITQQLAKTLFLTPQKTFSRKVEELLISFQLELQYTKEEILTFYFNQIYFGELAYGLEAAAQTYFGHEAKSLSVSESALLAGLLKGPTIYSPYKNMVAAVFRRNLVLRRMYEESFINEINYKIAVAEPVSLVPKERKNIAPYFIEELRMSVEKKVSGIRLRKEGFEIFSSLNIELQKIAEKAVENGLLAIESRVRKRMGGELPENYHPVQAALVAIEPATGEVKALVGGRNFGESEFNRATMALRQPGSAFKPIVYLTALEQGYTASSIIIDSPVIFNEDQIGMRWKPANYSNKFYGPVTIKRALADSLNVATVKLYLDLEKGSVIEMSKRLGIDREFKDDPTLSLGSGEVTLLELVNAYSTFANYGIKNNPSFFRNISSESGDRLLELEKTFFEAISPQNAFLITTFLKEVVRSGTGNIAQDAGVNVAAKTGTTDNFTDAWFVGFSPGLAVGVWVGYDNAGSLGEGETGAMAAGPIWTEFMSSALKIIGDDPFEIPETIIAVDVDIKTGLLANHECGVSERQYFIVGTEPRELCGEINGE
ncbi:MAG: PBP1A family penicillin-binding protein [Nitrospinota bacterium]|nr:PBP1A family penicillin-binding protein [Nitrospinota bacterium]